MNDQHDNMYPQAPPAGYQPVPGYQGYPPPGYPQQMQPMQQMPPMQHMAPPPAQQQVDRFKWVNTALIAVVVIVAALAWGAGSWITSIDSATAAPVVQASVDAQPPSRPQPRVADEQLALSDEPQPRLTSHAAPSLFDDEPTVVTRLEITGGLDGQRGNATYQFAQPGDKPSHDEPVEDELEQEVIVQLHQPGAELGLQRRDATFAPTTQPATRMPARTTDFTRALSFHRAGDFDRALTYYQQTLAMQPTHFGAYNNLGVLHMQMGEFEKAIDVLHEAAAINPDDALVYNNLANCHMQIGQYEQAVRSLEKSLSLESSNLAALTNMGIAHTAMGDLEAARVSLERAVQLHPNEPRALYNLGNLYRRQRDTPSAMRTYLQFLESSNGRYPEREAQVRALLSNTGSW